MKPSEIIASLPQWREAKPADILASPAWAMPCRLGDSQDVMLLDAVRPADMLSLAIRFEDEPHILGLAASPRFPELSRLWASLSEVPEPILLALVEKECGPFLQMLENAVRRQLKIDGISKDSPGPEAQAIAARIADVTFTLTRSVTIETAFGQLRFIDLTHPSIRETQLAAEYEYAAFALPREDIASLAPGDALLVPEIGTAAPRVIADGRFILDENGVSAQGEDDLVRVRSVEPRTTTLGELFDGAVNVPHAASPLKLVVSGRTVAVGRLDSLAGQQAFFVEKV